MDTKSKINLTLLLLVLVLTAFRCSNDSKLLESIPESSYIDNCPDVLYEFGDRVSVGDPNNKFLISLPYSWDIRESYGDSLYGVFASNFLSVPKVLEDRMSLSVTGYTTDLELDQYVHDELLGLVKDESTRILERGNSMFAGQQNPWVLFKMAPGIYNMVYYVKLPEQQDIFLIQTASYDTVNYRSVMCNLKQLINSFEVVK